MSGPLFSSVDLESITPVDPGSATVIRSAHLIAHMATEVGAGREAAAAIVDGFWDYVADVRSNYRHSSDEVRLPKAWLVIPNFGTFYIRRTQGRKFPGLRLAFRSRRPDRRRSLPAAREGGLLGRIARFFSAKPEPKREEAPPAQKKGTGLLGPWVESAGRPEDLSIKRRMALSISRETGLDLRLTAGLLDTLLLAILSVFERGASEGARAPTIHWARRGVMLPDGHYVPVGSVYRFRCAPGYARQIAES